MDNRDNALANCSLLILFLEYKNAPAKTILRLSCLFWRKKSIFCFWKCHIVKQVCCFIRIPCLLSFWEICCCTSIYLSLYCRHKNGLLLMLAIQSFSARNSFTNTFSELQVVSQALSQSLYLISSNWSYWSESLTHLIIYFWFLICCNQTKGQLKVFSKAICEQAINAKTWDWLRCVCHSLFLSFCQFVKRIACL